MQKTENQVLLQYRISPAFSGLRLALDTAQALAVLFGKDAAQCTLTSDELTHNGTLEEFITELPNLASYSPHTFVINVPMAAAVAAFQKELQETQQQIQELQQKPTAAVQQPEIARQLKALQQNQRAAQQRLGQAQQASVSFSVNFVLSSVSLTAGGLPAVALKQSDPDKLNKAVAAIRSRLPPEEADPETRTRAISFLEKMRETEAQLSEIQQLATHARTILTGARDSVSQAEDARVHVGNALDEVTSLRRRVENEMRSVTSLESEILRKKSEATTDAESTKTSAAAASAHKERTQTLLGDITAKNETAATILAQIRAKASELETSFTDAQTTIVRTKEATQNRLTTEILPEWSEKFKNVLDDAEKKRDNIHRLLGASVAADLSTAFKNRQEDLEKGQWVWLFTIAVISATITGVSIYYVIPTVDGVPSTFSGWMLRALTLLPLIILDIFCVSQYQRKVTLADQYAFKAAVAASFNFYKDELNRSLKEGSQVADFVSQMVTRLWVEPSHVTELSALQIRRFTRLLENLGVTAIKEGSAVAQSAIQSRVSDVHDPTISRQGKPGTLHSSDVE